MVLKGKNWKQLTRASTDEWKLLSWTKDTEAHSEAKEMNTAVYSRWRKLSNTKLHFQRHKIICKRNLKIAELNYVVWRRIRKSTYGVT